MHISIWIEAARSEQASGPIKLHRLEVHWYLCYLKKNPTLKNEADIPHVLSITFITRSISIFKKCEFIFDLCFMKGTIIQSFHFGSVSAV